MNKNLLLSTSITIQMNVRLSYVVSHQHLPWHLVHRHLRNVCWVNPSIHRSTWIITHISLVSRLQTKFQNKHAASKITTRAKWLYMYKEFLSKCQGKVEEEIGKYTSWHGSPYPTAKWAEQEMDLCANSANSEPGRFHPNSHHNDWSESFIPFLFCCL